MAKKKRRNGGNLVGTTMKFIRIGSLIGPGLAKAIEPANISPSQRLANVMGRYCGFDFYAPSGFHGDWLWEGWGPYLVTTLATRGIQKLSGIIRRI